MARIGTFLFKAALIDHFSVALDEGYIDKSAFNQFRKEMLDSIKILKGAIRFILSLWRN